MLTLVGGTSLTLEFTNFSSGYYFATNSGSIQGGRFKLLPTLMDLDANGRSDLVFRNTNTAAISTWFMEGANFVGSARIREGNFPKDWEIVGQGDFSGDRQSDLLFRHKDGRHALWFLNGNEFISAVSLRSGLKLSSAWKTIGVTDLDGNGHNDIILQHDVGMLAAWYFNGTNYVSTGLLRDGALIGTAWRGVGTGDFNNDGRPDILFQRTDGRLAAWFMNNNAYLGTGLLREGKAVVGWRAAGVADINSDGKSDVLFQNGTGTMSVWYMDGTNYISGELLRGGQGSGKTVRLSAPR